MGGNTDNFMGPSRVWLEEGILLSTSCPGPNARDERVAEASGVASRFAFKFFSHSQLP